MSETIQRSSAPIAQLLRPQTKLELIFDVDLINDFIDVRNAVVLNITPQYVVVSQPDPPIVRSMVGSNVEATFVSRDSAAPQVIRWGWHGQIIDFIKDYRLHENDAQGVPAVAISSPPNGNLRETNARMDYRLTLGNGKRVSIQTHPSFGRVHLFDFSAGGVLIGIPAPPQATVGMRLWFTLFFPGQDASSQQITINGEAEVVRVAYEAGDQYARVGLKFQDLDLSATRSLQKAINRYMLEEQKLRNQEG